MSTDKQQLERIIIATFRRLGIFERTRLLYAAIWAFLTGNFQFKRHDIFVKQATDNENKSLSKN